MPPFRELDNVHVCPCVYYILRGYMNQRWLELDSAHNMLSAVAMAIPNEVFFTQEYVIVHVLVQYLIGCGLYYE